MKLPKRPLRYTMDTTELGNETTSNQASAYLASLGFTGFPKTPTAQALSPFRVKLASVDSVAFRKTWVWKFPTDQSSEGESYPTKEASASNRN